MTTQIPQPNEIWTFRCPNKYMHHTIVDTVRDDTVKCFWFYPGLEPEADLCPKYIPLKDFTKIAYKNPNAIKSNNNTTTHTTPHNPTQP